MAVDLLTPPQGVRSGGGGRPGESPSQRREQDLPGLQGPHDAVAQFRQPGPRGTRPWSLVQRRLSCGGPPERKQRKVPGSRFPSEAGSFLNPSAAALCLGKSASWSRGGAPG